MRGTIYGQLQSFIGKDTALQLQLILKNAAVSTDSSFAAVVGFVTLIIGATTMFADMQDSINYIWGLKPNPKAPWYSMVIDRLISFGVVASLAFLLLVSLSISALIASLDLRLQQQFPHSAISFLTIANIVFPFLIITALFLIIFKMLPNAKVKWKDVLSGAIVTSILFMLGKFGISFYISNSNIGSTYGAAGSLVVLLVWVYFSAVILYFGAEFTKAFALEFGSPIHPGSHTVIAKKIEVQEKNKSIQIAEKEISQEEKKRNKDD